VLSRIARSDRTIENRKGQRRRIRMREAGLDDDDGVDDDHKVVATVDTTVVDTTISKVVDEAVDAEGEADVTPETTVRATIATGSARWLPVRKSSKGLSMECWSFTLKAMDSCEMQKRVTSLRNQTPSYQAHSLKNIACVKAF